MGFADFLTTPTGVWFPAKFTSTLLSRPAHHRTPSRNTALFNNKPLHSMRSTNKDLEMAQQCSSQDKHHKFKLASQLVKRALTPLTSQRQKPFNFLSLPAEIRNEILSYVLVPGEVHIRATKEHGMKATIKHVRKEMQRFCSDYQQTKYYGTKWRIQYVRETMQCFYLRCQEIPRMPSLPGFQMLATCKSVYEQNHEQYTPQIRFSCRPVPWRRRPSISLKFCKRNIST